METAEEVIAYLQDSASQKYKKNVIAMGIPEKDCIGVSTGEIRKLAKELGIAHDLAGELWRSGYHEARILAVLIMDKGLVDFNDIDALMAEVISWDLCDYLCKNLIIRMPDPGEIIARWSGDKWLY